MFRGAVVSSARFRFAVTNGRHENPNLVDTFLFLRACTTTAGSIIRTLVGRQGEPWPVDEHTMSCKQDMMSVLLDIPNVALIDHEASR